MGGTGNKELQQRIIPPIRNGGLPYYLYLSLYFSFYLSLYFYLSSSSPPPPPPPPSPTPPPPLTPLITGVFGIGKGGGRVDIS